MPRNRAPHAARRSMLAGALLMAIAASGNVLAAPFVYQGTLNDGGHPANGRYDLQLQLYPSARGLDPIGTAIVIPAVQVTRGVFRVETEIASTGNGDAAYVSVGVRDSGAKTAFTLVSTREKVALGATAIGACWSTTGDAGSSAAINFLGTTDAQPLVMRVQNQQVSRYEPSAVLSSGAPISANVIAGSAANSVVTGARGAVIAGGGIPFANADPNFLGGGPNRVTDSYGVVGGGYANTAGDSLGTTDDHATFATVAGGESNTASGTSAAVGGGSGNVASGDTGTVGGGRSNTAVGADTTVGGGEINSASGFASTIPGGYANCAGGTVSFAAGVNAKVRPGTDPGSGTCTGLGSYPGGSGDDGTFVWSDSEPSAFVSTGKNQFLVRAAGGVGINTNTISSIADVVIKGRGGSNADLYLESGGGTVGYNLAGIGTSGADTQLYFAKVNGTTLTDVARFNPAGVFQVFINTPISPTGGSWASASDARFKHDIRPLSGALDRLLELQGVTFEYNADIPKGYGTPGRRTGFVAQQVETVFPEWVSVDANGYRLVAPNGFEALTVEALRELRAREDSAVESAEADAAQANQVAQAQATRVANLETQLAALSARMEALARENATLRWSAVADTPGREPTR